MDVHWLNKVLRFLLLVCAMGASGTAKTWTAQVAATWKEVHTSPPLTAKPTAFMEIVPMSLQRSVPEFDLVFLFCSM